MQDPAPFLSLHIAFEPQGDGLQGLRGSTTLVTKIIINNVIGFN